MKEIKLTQGQAALVDDEDYEQAIKAGSWWVKYDKARDVFIAEGWIDGKRIYMHRFIMDAPPGKDVDHQNHDTLDNRRNNLRLCTRAENLQNMRRGQRNGHSQYKWVSWDKSCNKWQANITRNYKNYKLGRFDCEREAAQAYNQAALQYFGEFAYLNDI